MIKSEIEKLQIDVQDAMMSGDYESVVKILKLIIEHIENLEK
tara:strand:- start:157 stop:282 length:126 start_codon:yes stop_codon:yes gene_type:complete